MLRWSIGFFVVALIAAFLGFGGLAGDAAWMGKVAFVIFLIATAITFLMGRRTTVV